SIFKSKKMKQHARLLRLRLLRIYFAEKLVENKIYTPALRILRFHTGSYFPGAREEIIEFTNLFSLSKKGKYSKNIASTELHNLYKFIMGKPRSGKQNEPQEPVEREVHARKLATVKTLLSLRRTMLRSLLGEEIAFPASNSPYTKGYLALTLDRAEYQQLRHHTEEIVDMRRENQTHVHDTLSYIRHAIDLTRSPDSMRIIAGLMALTGRRPVEVAITGAVSSLTGDGRDYCLVFEGQAKTKERTGTMHDLPYPIPTLCAPRVILDAWKRLRSSERGQQISAMAPRTFNTRLGTTLGYIVGAEFSRYLRGTRENAQPKDLRGIYAEICNQIYNGDGLVGRRIMDNGLYYRRILGHGAHSGQVSDAYKAFVLDDLPATQDPRQLPTLAQRPPKPPSLRGLSSLGLPRSLKKKTSA
ncbi:MAG: hypothetical protein EB054_03590, partial [Actinobacteria bacterium]|nr:hypothetical protein [Actinomycetota bacterium]